jgi:hypothetical protein
MPHHKTNPTAESIPSLRAKVTNRNNAGKKNKSRGNPGPDRRLPAGKTTESGKTWFTKSCARETQAPNEKFEAGKLSQIGGQTGHGRVLLPRRKLGARKNQPTAEKLIRGRRAPAQYPKIERETRTRVAE